MKILAIILARKIQKTKKKHHLELDGKSLIDHTFDLLKKVIYFLI